MGGKKLIAISYLSGKARKGGGRKFSSSFGRLALDEKTSSSKACPPFSCLYFFLINKCLTPAAASKLTYWVENLYETFKGEAIAPNIFENTALTIFNLHGNLS